MKTHLIYLLFIVLFLVGCHDQTTEITNSQSQENAKSQYLVPEEQAVNVAMSFSLPNVGCYLIRKQLDLNEKCTTCH